MNTERITEKSREALTQARQMSLQYRNQEIAQEHLAWALLSDENGLIPQLLTKMGKTPKDIAARLETLVARLPKVMGSNTEADKIYISTHVEKALSAAQERAVQMKDEYLSVEHIFLGLITQPSRTMAEVWKSYSIDEQSFLPVLNLLYNAH